jgi:hypothetical protein
MNHDLAESSAILDHHLEAGSRRILRVRDANLSETGVAQIRASLNLKASYVGLGFLLEDIAIMPAAERFTSE